MRRIAALSLAIALVSAACVGSSEPTGPLPDPPVPTTYEELTAYIASAGHPIVLNVWASWCLPCRAEAPLLAAGSIARPNVEFIGLNVRDKPGNASAFIAKYLAGARMTQFSDRKGNIPVQLGGTRGVPLSFFYRANGELAGKQLGIIDEPTLARFLDEIDR